MIPPVLPSRVAVTLAEKDGETSKTVTVQVKGDTLDEVNEKFLLNLTNPINATIADDEGICTIVDDDAPPSLSVNDVSVVEGNSGTTPFTFTVSLSAASSKTVKVQVATANSTSNAATSGVDYVALATLTFAPGETTKTVTVQVNDDTLNEPVAVPPIIVFVAPWTMDKPS